MASGKKKVSVIGAGNVGATVAFHVVQQGYANVVLLDLPDDLTLERPRKNRVDGAGQGARSQSSLAHRRL